MNGAPNARYCANTAKAREVILWLANRKPGIDVYHVVKCAFYADKYHLNEYGRPLAGDSYNAGPYGPLGQVVYGLLRGDFFEILALGGNGELAFRVSQKPEYAVLPDRDANMDVLSESDVEALVYSVDNFGDKSFEELMTLTHAEAAYQNAEGDRIRYEDLLDESPDRDERVADIRDTASFAVF